MAPGPAEQNDPNKTQLQPSGVSSSDARVLAGAATEINAPDQARRAAGSDPGAASAAAVAGGAKLPDIPDVRLEQSLGEGGMGAVYKGRQLTLDRAVAVKVIHTRLAKDESFLQRFEREAKVLARLSHPNIVACYQAGKASGGEHFLLMEFVEGSNLSSWVTKKGPLTERDALVIVRQVADGLEHALEASVVHRDVKPENILLKPVPPRTAGTSIGVQAKLVDLGLAGLAGPQTEATKITIAGTVVGTPVTMAPEQASDPDKVSHGWDIYALGCTLYFAVTGKDPHEGKTIQEVLWKKLKDETPHPKRFREDLSEDLCQLILRIISFDPTKRPQTYEELLGLFDGLIASRAGPAGARTSERYSPSGVAGKSAIKETLVTPPPAGATGVSPGGGGAGAKVAAAVVVLAVLGGGGFLAFNGGPTPVTNGTNATPTSTVKNVAPSPTTLAPTKSPSAADDAPMNIAWGSDPLSLFGSGKALFGLFVQDPPDRGWKEPESDGMCDASAEGATEQVTLYLKETPAGAWRLHGGIYTRNAIEVGARVLIDDRTFDVAVQPLSPETVNLKIKLGDKPAVGRQLATLDKREGDKRDLTVQLSGGRLWARLEGPPDSKTGVTWIFADAPGTVKRVGLFVKKGAASFEQFTLDREPK